MSVNNSYWNLTDLELLSLTVKDMILMNSLGYVEKLLLLNRKKKKEGLGAAGQYLMISLLCLMGHF